MAKYARLAVVGLVVVAFALSAGETVVHARRRIVRRPVSVAAVPKPAPAASAVIEPVVDVPAPAPSELQIDPRQALADIMALRQAQGMGADAEFSGALQRLISEKHGPAPTAPAVDPITPIEASTPPLPAQETVDALRASAQHFDERASAFESQKAYAEADAARQTASDLRMEARRLDP